MIATCEICGKECGLRGDKVTHTLHYFGEPEEILSVMCFRCHVRGLNGTSIRVDALKVTQLDEGDVVILTCPADATAKKRSAIGQELGQVFPNNPIVVLPDGWQLGVIQSIERIRKDLELISDSESDNG